MSFLRRYERDTTAPTVTQARNDLGRRTLRPAGLLWLANVSVGWVIVGPLDSLPAEEVVNEELAEERTALMNDVTQVGTNIGGTHFLILACVVVVAAVWWRTRHWWLAVVPAISLSVQSAVFTTASFLVGRGRPDVEHLDVSPPTSGFPSGHTGASTAFYLAVALLAQRIRRPGLRWTMTALCVVIPLLVGFSRMYRGMHFLSDVIAGLVNGVVCAWLAWRYLRRDDRPDRRDEAARGPGAPLVGGDPAGEPSAVDAGRLRRRVISRRVSTSRAAPAPARTPRTRRTPGPSG